MYIQNFDEKLTKTQKASLKSFLKSLVKKHSDKKDKELLRIFSEEIKYQFDIGLTRYFWIKDFIEDEKFGKYVLFLIKNILNSEIYKKSRQPYAEKQKELAKLYRKKMQTLRQSKEKPTKKQILYYNSLCEKYKIEKKDTELLSKLDLKELISNILDENKKV